MKRHGEKMAVYAPRILDSRYIVITGRQMFNLNLVIYLFTCIIKYINDLLTLIKYR